MGKKLIIIGASGHGKVIADIARNLGYELIEFLDDNLDRKYCGHYNVVGRVKDYKEYLDYDFIVGIGNADIREKMQTMLINDNCKLATLVHPNATIGEDVMIGAGTVVMAGAVINPGSNIGEGVIINTCSSVDHDCEVKNFAHISVGAHVAGTVCIGERTWVGAGATIINNVSITRNCMIGAGATVIHDLNYEGTYVGVPAKKL